MGVQNCKSSVSESSVMYAEFFIIGLIIILCAGSYVPGLIHARLFKFKDFSRTSKSSPAVFKDNKFMKNPYLHFKIKLCKWTNKHQNTRIKLLCLYLVQHVLHEVKAQQIYSAFSLHQHG